MSEYFGYENFRSSRQETIIDLERITILTGPNSSGKSSVIKAAKLLKQNINSQARSGLPLELSFLPDEFGHNLGSFGQVVNRTSQSEDVSFIIPINLVTLGSNFYGKLVYGPIEDGPYKGTITMKSFSVFHKKEQALQLISIIGAFGDFYEMEINPILIKSCLEHDFIPYITKKDVIFIPDVGEIEISNKDNFPGKELLETYIFILDKIYSTDKPIMPLYTLFEDKSEKKIQFTIESHDVYDFFNTQIIKFQKENQIIDYNEALYEYFMELESGLFKLIGESKLRFGVDTSIDISNLAWWNGIRLDYAATEDIKNPVETGEAIRLYNEMLFKLMNCYESIPDENDQSLLNHDIFRDYIQYIVVESIECCRQFIDSYRFADLNRIEQVMQYSNSGSQIAFKVINDFFKINSRVRHGGQIATYLRRLSIAEDYRIEQGNSAYTIQLLKEGNWVPLSEMGFGISKIFFCLIALQTYNVVFLEEPESNLHPDYQSKLADIIQEFAKDKRIIIETHSEYLIRKFQYLVATSKIVKDDIVIHYFTPENQKDKSKDVKTIRIKRDGGLDGDFGPGFYDEASNIIKDLFNLTYYN